MCQVIKYHRHNSPYLVIGVLALLDASKVPEKQVHGSCAWVAFNKLQVFIRAKTTYLDVRQLVSGRV